MKITSDSHVDHGLSEQVIALILERFGAHEGFGIHTLEIPEELGEVKCALIGPLTGHPPVTADQVYFKRRDGRAGESRMVDRPLVSTRLVTVIHGYHNGETILFTAYGGPCAPRERYDHTLSPEERQESIAFWEQHALATGEP